MAIDPTVARSRRAILAASVGGAAALVAGALGRPLPARAANGDTVTVGGSFSGTSPTAITSSAGDAIQAFNTATTASGLFAHATATGNSTTYGVFGRSNSNEGIGVAGVNYAATGATRGVMGQADSSSGVGVFGTSSKYIGVLAQSDTGIGVRAQSTSGDGVFGSSASAPGVRGNSVSGAGVYGVSGSGFGVQGSSDNSIGMRAHSTSNTALFATSGAGNAVAATSNGD